MSYSIDLRKKVIDYVNEGGSKASASRLFGISQPIIYRWLKKYCLGDLRDSKPKRPWRKIDPVSLLNLVNQNPGWQLKDFAELFKVRPASMCHAFKVLQITRKKSPTCIKKETKKNAEYFWTISNNTQKKS